MDTESLVTDTERALRILSTALTDPHDGECLLCYVYRMLEYGCTGLRWAYVHVIEEYARHNGHADILREQIDGVTED